jgi:hypothetical protein
VIKLLSAGPRGRSSYPANKTDVHNARRTSDEIVRAVLQADEDVVTAIMETAGHGFRAKFMTPSAALTYGEQVPVHLGDFGMIEVRHKQTDDVSDFRPAKPASLAELELWRKYPDIFPDAEGFAKIFENAIYFTGYTARVRLCTYTRDDTKCQSPIQYDAAVVAGAIGLLPARGDALERHAYYQDQAARRLVMIRTGKLELPRLEPYLKAA